MSEFTPTHSDTTSPSAPVETPNVQPSHTTADFLELAGASPPPYTPNQNVTPFPLTQQPYPAQQTLSPPAQQHSDQHPQLAPSSTIIYTKPAKSSQQDTSNRNQGQWSTPKFATNPIYFRLILIFAVISMLFSLPIGACATCVALYARNQFRDNNYNSALVLSWISSGLGIASIIIGIIVTVAFALNYSSSSAIRVVFS